MLPIALPNEARLPVWSVPSARAAERHPALVYLAALAPGSRRTMRQSLDVVAALVTGGRADHQTLPWHLLRYQHTAAVRAALVEQYKPATANKVLAALRGTLKAAWRLELVDAETYHRAADVVAVRGNSPPAGRELTPGEIRALLEACAVDPSTAGVRDAAILALLYGAGLRRAEAVRLDVAHLEPDGMYAGRVTVHGKGDKAGFAYARGASLDVLRAWLLRRGDGAGALLLPVSQRGVVVHTRALRGGPEAPARLTEHAVYKRLRIRAVEPACGRSPRTTAGAPSPATCSTPGPTSPPCRSCSATRAWLPLASTTAAASAPSATPPTSCISRTCGSDRSAASHGPRSSVRVLVHSTK
jgi:site-specific recombinase XerC